MSLGLYIHIPFCTAKCNYCHFASIPFHPDTAARYKKAVLAEIEGFDASGAAAEVDSIYFGGGTPSLIPEMDISEILDECRRRFRVSEDCEISLEANPGTIAPEKAAAYRDLGINRISMGAQSFDAQELKAIGRLHAPDTILQSLDIVRRIGFKNINLDLMLGLPLQTADSWKRNLEIIERLAIPHISAYMLDLDEECLLKSLIDTGAMQLPEEDLISDLYLETIEFFSKCGIPQYEISNFSRPGHACRHNLKYWKRVPVLGFGLGSHSYDGNSRYANYADMSEYLRAMESGSGPTSWCKPVAKVQALQETLFLGLRLTEGIDLNQLRKTYERDPLSKYDSSLKELAGKGLVEYGNSVVRLTPSGMLLSNEIFQLFV